MGSEQLRWSGGINWWKRRTGFFLFITAAFCEGMLGSGEIGKWQMCSWKRWNKILTALGKGPLPCCVASARHTHLPVISHSLVISFCGGDYNQLRRYSNVSDHAAVLNCCIVPLSLLCPPSKPMAIQTIQWRADKSIPWGGRSRQFGFLQVKLPNTGVMLFTVEQTRAKHCDDAVLISENL